ncbi:hypothetical protein L873DRAFT_454109 [Choiromyces venosus 120613-1]|uniref:Cytochrome c oxidase assembly factor 3 n=1 Tax=Choiromyces venosus 120613-1 TaxID=1336337 RepID=A0A3N4JZ70_9PEZI|nr:hypothetical protein L873DRAFT_454109 [Choiromyces venosus 120613-1]
MHPSLKLLVLPRSTYYEQDQRQGASLIRARKPFLVKNLVTGLAMLGLTASIYVYTIKAVAQDEFEDVPIPDAPVQGPTTGAGAAGRAGGSRDSRGE